MLKQDIQARAPSRRTRSNDADFETLHPVIQRVLSNRNIQRKADIDHRLKNLLPPDDLKGIETAAQRVVEAIRQQHSILIVGDYDADGATATALAIKGLQSMGAHSVEFTVPNRFSDGYGLSLGLAKQIARNSPDVLITVDNGISSIDGIAYLKQKQVDVIVTDHHLAGEHLPQAYAIVNPNQPGCRFQSKALAGVGVMFYLILAIHKILREIDYFEQHSLQPDVLDLLDLVALGTVADLVPLDKNNRILVAQGVARMRAGKSRPGIAALMKVAGREVDRLVAQDLGFVVGPRLNAAGRLEDISSGIDCLLADDVEHAKQLAEALDHINQTRKGIEQSMQAQALSAVKNLQLGANKNTGLVLYNESWHEGVVGLVASRIKDKTGLPALVFAPGEGGELKGSARSIPEVHIRDILANINALHPTLIVRFGGHAMAAGLSILPINLSAFRDAFETQVAIALKAKPPSNTLLTDGSLSGADFNKTFADSIKTLIPWGQTCPEPQFEGEFIVLNCRFVGEIHLKLVLKPLEDDQPVDAISFRYLDHADSPEKRTALSLKKIRAVYHLDVNHYRGQQSLQLIIRYLEAA